MKHHQGAALPEFAIVALVFFMVLFSAIEVGRWMFMWNTLTEATRRGARIASVCPYFDNYIKVATVFGDPSQPDAAQNSSILPGLSTSNVSISYFRVLDTVNPLVGQIECAGSTQPPPTMPVGSSSCSGDSTVSSTENPTIRLVQVSITYNSNFIAPVIGAIFGSISSPTFKTLLPVESLGDLQSSPNHCP